MTYFGYVSPKTFGTFNLPVPYQNKLLRMRASELGTSFGLGVGEIVLPDCYIGLFETLRTANPGDIIGCCSVQLLPKDERLETLQEFLDKRELLMDFLFEFTGVQGEILKLVQNLDWADTIGRGVDR